MNPNSSTRLAILALAALSVTASADTVTVPLRPVADSRIFDADWGRDNNDGNGGDIGVYQARDRSLLRFDLSALPTGSTLSAASLTLTVSGTFGGNPGGESMNIHRLTQSWTEGGVTWNHYDGTNTWASAGGDYDASVRATSTANPGVGGSIAWDVTGLAQEWASNTHPNHGLIVINSGSTNGLHFASKENGNGSYRPYLTATITTPTSAPAGAWTWSGGAGVWTDADEWLDAATPATWVDGKDAIFGTGSDAADTVTLSGTVAPKSLWFLPSASGNYSLTGGTIDLGGTSRIIQTDASASIVSSLSNGALIKQGAGTLSLTSTGMGGSAVNTYAGGTVISGGTVEIYGRSADNGGYTSLGTGSVTIQNGATLVSASDWTTGNEWNSGNVGTITLNGGSTWTINGAGNTVRNGLVLNGATVNGTGNSGDWGGLYLRDTTVTAGGAAVSSVAVDTALNGATPFDVGSGSQLNYSGPIHNKIESTGAITKTGAGTLNLSGNNTYTGTTTVQGGLIEISGGTSSLAGFSLASGNLAFSGGTTTLSGSITSPNPYASGNLVFNGNCVATVTGTLQLSNLSAPSITVQDDANVTLQSGLQVGEWGNGIYLLGGTLRTPSLAASSQSWGYPSRWMHLDGTTIVATASSGNFISMLSLDSTNNVAVGESGGAIFNTNGHDVTIGVNLVNESGQEGTLTKLGNGTLTLSGQNSYTGDTTVFAGTLELASASLADTSTVSIDAGAVLHLNHAALDQVAALVIDGTPLEAGVYDASSPETSGYITGSGSIEVPSADPFLDWITPFAVDDETAEGDPDQDGIANLLEYVLEGGDPSLSSSSILPSLDASGSDFVFSFSRRADATGTTQVFQYSPDLGVTPWTELAIPGGSGVSVTDVENDGVEEVVITVPKGANTKLFGRLKVTQP
jgi:autotransporter-associated beta strand protein